VKTNSGLESLVEVTLNAKRAAIKDPDDHPDVVAIGHDRSAAERARGPPFLRKSRSVFVFSRAVFFYAPDPG